MRSGPSRLVGNSSSSRRMVAVFSSAAILVTLLVVAPQGARAQNGEVGARPADMPTSTARVANASDNTLSLILNERGRVTLSMNGLGTLSSTGSISITKPPGATVRKALYFVATTGFQGYRLTVPMTLNGASVTMGNEVASGIGSYNYWTDVTSVVKPTIDAGPAGAMSIAVGEPSSSAIDGSVLAVVFDDPNLASDSSVGILYGALQPGGDQFGLTLDRPFDPTAPGASLRMSLGISFGCQGPGGCGGTQYSTVDVNGRRITSSAGGQDDGVLANGALITVGGEGDDPANPANPNALATTARSDDELYELRSFIPAGSRAFTIDTTNPSNDDNIFLAAIVGNPPVSQISSTTLKAQWDPTVGAIRTFLDGVAPGARVEFEATLPSGQVQAFSCLPARENCATAQNVARGYLPISRPTSDVTIPLRAWVDTNANLVRDSNERVYSTTVSITNFDQLVTVGDSYSSGEGANDYDDDSNTCHRSRVAFTRIIKFSGGATPARDLVACSGGRSYNFPVNVNPQDPLLDLDEIRGLNGLNSNRDKNDLSVLTPTSPFGPAPGVKNENRQFIQIKGNPTRSGADLVFIGIGGNDAKWTALITSCAANSPLKGCDAPDYKFKPIDGESTQFVVTDFVNAQIPRVLDRIGRNIDELRTIVAPDTTIVLVGYPMLFPSWLELNLSDRAVCQGALANALNRGEIDLIRRAQRNFDDGAVALARSKGVHFVSLIDAYESHEVCGRGGTNFGTNNDLGQWLNDIVFKKARWTIPFTDTTISTGIAVPWKGVASESFHPNPAGHRGARNVIEAYLKAWEASGKPMLAPGLPANPPPSAAASRQVASALAAAPTVDWSGDLELLPANGACAPALPTLSPGSPLIVAASGYAPGASVAVNVRYGDRSSRMATVTANAGGAITSTVRIPPSVFSGGLGEIAASGPETDGRTLVVFDDNVIVSPVDLPCAASDSVTTDFLRTVNVAVLANDVSPSSAPLSVRELSPAVHGTVSTDGTSITYRPARGFTGTESISYLVCAGEACGPAILTIVTTAPSCTITGTAGNDVLVGTPGPDVICGLGGDDILFGRDGDDVLLGGPGGDALFGEGGADIDLGGIGPDIVEAGPGDINESPDDPLDVGPAGFDVDAPTISITNPKPEQTVDRGAVIAPVFRCVDDSGAVATCTADRTTLDTATAGRKTLNIVATDAAGNTSTTNVAYRVVIPELPDGAPTPVASLDCVAPQSDGSYLATFSAVNATTAVVRVAIGPRNTVVGAGDVEGPPETFAVGVTRFRAVFATSMTWTLGSTTITASSASPPCSRPVGAIWATGIRSDAVFISGVSMVVNGPVHSEGGVSVTGAGSSLLGGVELVGTLTTGGARVVVNPAAVRVVAGQSVARRPLASYRPGGTAAVAAGTGYVAVPLSACVNGVWQANAIPATATVVYVPCAVVSSSAGQRLRVTIVAEGDVTISGAQPDLASTSVGAPAIVSGGSIRISGSTPAVSGAEAVGAVVISGANSVLCGLVGDSVLVSGARAAVGVCAKA